jgi:hypothetical protein
MSNAFFDLLNRTGDIIEETEEEVVGVISINQHNYKCKSLAIANKTFTNRVSFDDLDIIDGIAFSNCKFLEGIAFNKVRSSSESTYFINEGIRFSGCTVQFDISFIECNFKSNINITNNERIGSIWISNNTHIHSVFITNNINGIGEIRTQKTTVNNTFLTENNIITLFQIYEGKLGSIKIKDNAFENDFTVSGIEAESLRIVDNKVERKLNLTHLKSCNELIIEDNIVKQQLHIDCADYTRIDTLAISGGNYGHGFIVQGSKNNITQLHYYASVEAIGLFTFSNLRVFKLFMFGLIKNASIQLNKIQISELVFSGITNHGNISILDIRPLLKDSIIKIENSDLGQMQILNTDFSHFNVEINSSFISKIASSEVTWFNPEKLNNSFNDYYKTKKANREIYRQLKQAMYSQGDTIQAITFKSLEMDQYHEQIKLEKQFREISSWRETGDRISIFLNRFSNRNGLSWTRPIGLIITLTVIVYVLVIFNTPINQSVSSLDECSKTSLFLHVLWDKSDMIFRLMDPTSKLKEVLDVDETKNISAFITFLYFIYKIALAYLIFQTIAAFRKYLK